MITDSKARMGPWAGRWGGKLREPSPLPPPPWPPPSPPPPQITGPREKAKSMPPGNARSMRNEVRQVPAEMLSFTLESLC